MRAHRSPARRSSSALRGAVLLGAAGTMVAGSATAANAAHLASAAPAAPGPIAQASAPLATRLVDADANYAGVGVNGRGMFSLQTNALANVSFYSAQWNKTVCGIRDFGLYYDAEGSDGLPVDEAGIFVEQYAITYRSGGRRYTVQAIDSAQIGQFVDEDGVTRDMVVFRERVRVRQQRKGARWCSGVHKKAFVGYRITNGA